MIRLLRSLGRRGAMAELDRIDAELARWLVYDGALSLHPLDAPPLNGTTWRDEMRVQRQAAVRRLERWGGTDPWPTVLREPTDAQREARRP